MPPSAPSKLPTVMIDPAPTMCSPYSRYRFEAVVDWIELEIRTTTPTNHQTVKRRMGLKFAKGLDEGAGKAATLFRVKIQDPTSWAEIDAALERLTHDHPLDGSVLVVGIEIALDAYSKDHDRDELVNMTARFYKFACMVVADNARLAARHRDVALTISDYGMLVRRLYEGMNVYIGNKGADEEQHLYVKTTDMGGKLPVKRHRARTEITLRGVHLPHDSLAGWSHHNFTKQAAYFKYRKLKDPLPPTIAFAVAKSPQIGEKAKRARKVGGTRLYSPSTMADTWLNAAAYAALRSLTARMNK